MATVHVGGQPLPGTFSNRFLAHLQVATVARFASGKGFILATTEVGEDGVERTVSHWLHPGLPVSFAYDVTDGSGGHLAPETLHDNEIEAITAAMDTPNGVRGSDGLWWPFADQL
ncbi:hypothetical protein NIIDNTM18_27940 [Mycolicibacterium litorale]|uniref:DUF7882 domain-containing protein n=1 Tax=Mycolicibacterium litorale TaxID=758802 RepID=A0A6S6P645_9MYCO|nr:hypothetical protein [Mycolicibacterium litorale]BCI53516.1 hypothetical protein NIIDNTM18_27940 [Mycolicibacterium litorale]